MIKALLICATLCSLTSVTLALGGSSRRTYKLGSLYSPLDETADDYKFLPADSDSHLFASDSPAMFNQTSCQCECCDETGEWLN